METDEKAKRKRQKRLCKQIRNQMEFYFSDANLQKDRFLRKQMDQTEDGWLNLDMFANFNKLKTLTTDMSLVAKALSTSELIQVSEDGNQIKRKFAVTDAKDVDDRTVYVENLPAEADHVWVKKVFSEFGRVVYVSLPRYRSTRDLKGFGFVEYQNKQEAEQACKELNHPVPEADKVGRFPVKHNKQMQELQKQLSVHKVQRTRTVSETEVMDIKAEDRKDQLTGGQTTRKRRWSQGSNGQENGDSVVKKSKLNKESFREENSDDSSDSDYDPEAIKKKKSETGSGAPNRKRKSSQATGKDDEDDEKPSKIDKLQEVEQSKGTGNVPGMRGEQPGVSETTSKEEATKKKKNRTKKKKSKEESKGLPELRVISKREWLELRGEYLQLQKQSMKKLKTALQQVSINPVDPGGAESVEMVDKESPVKKSKEPEFTAGVIVKLHSTQPLARKSIKQKIEHLGQVAYIDVLDGDTEAHVRCATSDDAAKIAAATVDEYTLSVLSGDSEKQYWEKLVADRTRKLSNKTRNKKRGKDKAIEKAGATTSKAVTPKKKHIVFDDM